MDRHYDSETLTDYLHGALDPETDAAIFAHLGVCEACRTAYNAEVALGEALRNAAQGEALDFPTDLVARIRLATREEAGASKIARWFRSRRVAWATLPAAAAVALALWFGGNELRQQSAPPAEIDASYYFEAHDAQTRSIPESERTGAIAFAALSDRPHVDAAYLHPNDPLLGEIAPGLDLGGPGN